MAERLKVFVNKTLTENDVVNGDEIELITTDSTTQAVIKNIYAGNSNVSNSIVENNNFKIMDTLTTSSGYELVDTNSTLKIKLPEAIPSSSFTRASITTFSTSLYNKYNKLTNNYAGRYIIKDGVVSSDVEEISITPYGQSLIGTMVRNSSGYWFAFDDYAQSGSDYMYKSTNTNPSSTSHWTLTDISPANYQYCVFDGMQTVYIFENSTTLKTYDIETKTLSTFPYSINNYTGTSTNGSTLAFLASGYIWYIPYGTYTRLYYINVNNPSNNGWFTLSSYIHNNSSYTKGAGAIDEDGRLRIIINSGTSTTPINAYVLLGDVDLSINHSGTSVTSGYSNSFTKAISDDNFSGCVLLDDGSGVAFFDDLNRIRVVTITGGLLYYFYTDDTLDKKLLGFSGIEEIDFVKEDFDIQIEAKIDGIEITEVN